MKKTVFIMMLMVLLVGALTACQPQTIVETVEVEVVKEVEVEKEVEVIKEVEVEVEKEVIVEVEADRPVVIGYSAPSLVGGQLDIQDAFTKKAQAKGWQVVTTNANGDSQKQLNDIEFLITSGVDSIVAVPNDSQAICSAVESAKEAGVPFYTIDRAPIGCSIDMIVQADNRLGGQQAGQAVIDFLTERYGEPMGKVLEVTGDLGQNVGVLRRDGFHDILDTYENVEVIQKVGNWDAAIGQQAVLDVATANPDLDAIYYHSDFVYTGGTLEALSQLGMLHKRGEEGHIFIASIDGGPFGCDAIRNGEADFAASQPIPDFGIINDWIEMKLNGEEFEVGEVVQEGALWSPANVFLNDDGTFELYLSTIPTSIDNVEEPALWCNTGN